MDSELDALFRSSAGASSSAVAIPSKKLEVTSGPGRDQDSIVQSKKLKGQRTRSQVNEVKKRKGKAKETESAHADPIDNSEPDSPSSLKHAAAIQDSDDSGSDSDTNSSYQIPRHESLKKKGKQSSKPAKVKYVPEVETAEQRDARTIFIGNIPIDVAKSKPSTKALKRHILSFVPTARIESLRFRSVAFQNPTSTLPDADDDGDGPRKRRRLQQRATEWREKHEGLGRQDQEAAMDRTTKVYMTPSQKRKLAFVKGDFHDKGESVNAYVVFAHPPPAKNPDDGKRPPREIMDPYQAANTAMELCDGTTFMERTLRVDLAGKGKMIFTDGGHVAKVVDPKLCVFVGNLDFTSKEEDLRAFFEALMREERGEPAGLGELDASDGDEDDGVDEADRGIDNQGEVAEVDKSRKWVKSVRIIRDRETQLGKGFAYVQFMDRACVDEVLALEESKLKFAKRTLRVQRCKTLPGAAKAIGDRKSFSTQAASDSKAKRSPSATRKPSTSATAALPTVVIPKGDPTLGERLFGLPKESRKEAKKADPDRVARRLAKKKARGALQKAGVEMTWKARPRERGVKKDNNKPDARKKGRVRSDRASARKNVKKDGL